MEPLFDRLARQTIVRKFFAAIRACDKRSDFCILSLSPAWRIPVSIGLLVTALCFVSATLIFGFVTILAIFMVLFCLGYIFLLPNLCLILFVKQNWPYRLVNLGVFLAYLFPVLALFFDWESILKNFGAAIVLFPIAAMLHFICLTFVWQRLRPDRAWKIMKFVISMFVMTCICWMAWETFVDGKIYCTDENFGYLSPGNWVSNWDGHPIAVVHQIPAVRQMGDPDDIIEGWSVLKLWCLWFSFFGLSLVISILFTWVQWIPMVKRALNTSLNTK